MHELSITKNLLEIVKDKSSEAKAQKVGQISIVVGELSGVEMECIQFYFDILKKDYNLEEAVLNFCNVPSLLKCRTCGQEFHAEDLPWICPGCGGYSLEILKGSECYVESIEVD